MKNPREIQRLKRHKRIALKMHGAPEKPRLVVYRSLNNIFGQVIDDITHTTICSLSTQDKELKKQFKDAGNVKVASEFGEIFAKKLKEKGISKIIFDRAGYLYHGRIKAFADALRKGGLEF
ncbi:MAG: 50S ribosomal protein L18 [Candidatus Omnitrophota bacterium]